jgi:hypothetical protein
MVIRKTKQFLYGGWYQWEGGGQEDRVKRVNMMERLHTHVHKWKKLDLLKLFQECKEENKGEW